jgi:methylated-DNA-[protein]-cysteine S-methyltransferase
VGIIWLARSDAGLVAVQLGGDEARLQAALARRGRGPSRCNPVALADDMAAFRAWLAGDGTPLQMDLDLGGLPAFTTRVLQALRKVPAGATCSYGELARTVGSPGAARAIGQVMNRNPLPIVIPCHRVVARDGIGGFGGGLAAKRALLQLEGVTRFSAPAAPAG